jgi:hypothetical protein
VPSIAQNISVASRAQSSSAITLDP